MNCVVNHFLKQEIWRNTCTNFIKTTKKINVNSVSKHFPQKVIGLRMSKRFMKNQIIKRLHEKWSQEKCASNKTFTEPNKMVNNTQLELPRLVINKNCLVI